MVLRNKLDSGFLIGIICAWNYIRSLSVDFVTVYLEWEHGIYGWLFIKEMTKMLDSLRILLEDIVTDTVKDSVHGMGAVSRLEDIVIESVDADSWGGITVYKVEGYVKVELKTGIFSLKPGRKRFSATVKGGTGKRLAINWEPGQIMKG